MTTVPHIMVVGQVPPPLGGQAVMVKKLIDSDFDSLRLEFVPMNFSRDMDDIGRFRLGKLFRLPTLIIRIWKSRLRGGAKALYYSPGGETVTAITRDIAILLSCRIFFSKLIFHIHAGGFTEVADKCPLPIRLLARLAYRSPDLAIQLTHMSPPDGIRIGAKRIVNVPNGLADQGFRYINSFRDVAFSRRIELLFVGVVCEDKGVMILLRSCSRLKDEGVEFRLRVAGRFYSSEFESECQSFIERHGLRPFVEFLGVVTGEEKWEMFCSSDIFCFPSFFKSENQSLVILEAMQFGLPCVATDWRSMSTMVKDGETGYIVPIKDPIAVADRIKYLVAHPDICVEMGRKARSVFLSKYTDAVWQREIESALSEE